MKIKVFVILFLIAILAGCHSHRHASSLSSYEKHHNVVSSVTSQVDGTKYIVARNIFCDNIRFELYQDIEKRGKGVVLLKAGKTSSSPFPFTKIGEGDSLLMKLDGQTYSFKSNNDAVTEHETFQLYGNMTHDSYYKTYVVPESFVKAAASSKVLLAKLYGLDNFFIEGKCSTRTLQEHREYWIQYYKQLGKDDLMERTQEDADSANRAAGINGFREFVKRMDATTW